MKVFCRLASTCLIGTLCAGQPKNDPPETSPDFGPSPESRFGQAYDGRQSGRPHILLRQFRGREGLPVPAAAVNVSRPGHADTFRASDNFFWLDPGESHTVTVKDTGGTTVEAWNADPAGVLSLHH